MCVCCGDGDGEVGGRGAGFELTIPERTLLTLQTMEESSEPFQRILSQLLSPGRQTQVLSHLPNMGAASLRISRLLYPCSSGKGCHSPVSSGFRRQSGSPPPHWLGKSTAKPLSGILGPQSEIQATTLPWPVELAGHSFPSTGPGSWLAALRSPQGSDGTWLGGLRKGKLSPPKPPPSGARPGRLSPSPPVGRADKTLGCCWSPSRRTPPRETRKGNDSGQASQEGRGGRKPEACLRGEFYRAQFRQPDSRAQALRNRY